MDIVGVLIGGVLIATAGLGALVVGYRVVWRPVARACGDFVRRQAGPDEALDGYRLGHVWAFEGFDVDRWDAGRARVAAEAEAARRRFWLLDERGRG